MPRVRGVEVRLPLLAPKVSMNRQAGNYDEIPNTLAASRDRRAFRKSFRNGLIAGSILSILISASVWFLAVALPSKTGSPFAPIRDLCAWIAGTQVGRGIL